MNISQRNFIHNDINDQAWLWNGKKNVYFHWQVSINKEQKNMELLSHKKAGFFFNWLWNLHILQGKILGIVKAVQKTVWLETARMFWTLFGLWVLYLGNTRNNVDDFYDADDLDDDDGDDSAVVDDSDDYDEMIMTLY